MKALLLICLIVVAPFVLAGEPATSVVKGKVLEVRDVEAYTYLRLKTSEGEAWAAVPKSPIKSGAEVTIENAMVMNNFESKSLKKTFPTILFGNLGSGTAVTSGGNAATTPSASAKASDVADAPVPKAVGANARTVAEILTKSAELKDKPVLVRGKVVKYNPAIMSKNWIHLRDGSGSAANGSNDILVTSINPVTVGEIVTVKGVVRTDKDFGAGYAYKVLIEEATVQR